MGLNVPQAGAKIYDETLLKLVLLITNMNFSLSC